MKESERCKEEKVHERRSERGEIQVHRLPGADRCDADCTLLLPRPHTFAAAAAAVVGVAAAVVDVATKVSDSWDLAAAARRAPGPGAGFLSGSAEAAVLFRSMKPARQVVENLSRKVEKPLSSTHAAPR